MAHSTEQQLEDIKYDLQKVIRDLKLSSGNLKDAKGLSLEICTEKIDKMICEYENLLRQLESVQLKEDESKIGE